MLRGRGEVDFEQPTPMRAEQALGKEVTDVVGKQVLAQPDADLGQT
jgi:hypothetical protein